MHAARRGVGWVEVGTNPSERCMDVGGQRNASKAPKDANQGES
jgi:hypothetical protein